jgi:5-formyltetrahydrofolate cyclo-ligase
MTLDSLLAEKQAVRARVAARRDDPALGFRLAGQVLGAIRPPPGAVVSGFWPLAGEIDPRPLLLALAGLGHALALPRTPPRGLPLTFHRWRFGDPLVPGPIGLSQPAAAAEPLEPDFLLVPLVAFDSALRRLGHGAGYYDRTLAVLRARKTVLALGIAFAGQHVPGVPTDALDQKLDAVATEDGVFRA